MLASMKNILVIGATGTIGSALNSHFRNSESSKLFRVFTLTRDDTDYSEESLALAFERLNEHAPFAHIISCIGTLHNEIVSPEKRLEQIQADKLAEYFRINTIIPSLCLSHFHNLLDKRAPATFTFLSAMVGSISDNQLGGWYGYRSSKAALNMMIKTASVELRRRNPMCCLVVIHPGTTIGPLSKPFSGGVSSDKYYTPEQSAQRIANIVINLKPEDTGSFLNWDGAQLPW